MRQGLTMLVLLALLGRTGAAFADQDCGAPMTDWQPRDAVQRMAEKQGWTVRRIKIDDGCYEIDGSDADGRTIEATIDPATLAIVSLDYEDDDRSVPENKPVPGDALDTNED
jgi:hypothetical protein